MILLVTADADFGRSFARLLAFSGHRTTAARDVREALAQAERLHPDVVLVEGHVAGEAHLLARLPADTPTIMLLNRNSLDDVLAAVDAIAPAEASSASR